MANHEPACVGTKDCARCHHTKPAIAFSANRDSADGMHAWCRDCVREYHVRRRIGKGRRATGFLTPILET